MRISIPKIAYAAVLLGGAAYGFVELRGPNGFSGLMQKRQEIKALERQNQDLHRDIEAKKKHIDRLGNNPEEQEIEIRKQLKLVKPGEKSYILEEPARR